MGHRFRKFSAAVAACLAIASLTGVALGAGQKFKESVKRGTGDTLVVSASSRKVFESFGFQLKKKGYKVKSAVLAKEDGKPTHLTAKSSPCLPAQNGVEAPTGNGVVCLSLLYLTGKQMGVRSVVIDITTNKCYPAGGGITGANGPKGGCRR
jgi:hypothetical protein